MSYIDFLTNSGSKGRKTVEETKNSGKEYVVFSLDDLLEFDQQMWYNLVNMPITQNNELKTFESDIKNVFSSNNIEVGFSDISSLLYIKLHDLGSHHVGRMVKIRGFVNRVSPVRPMITDSHFRCKDCQELYPQTILQENPLALAVPTRKCDSCGSKYYDVVPELCTTINSQEFSIQESHEDISSRGIPAKIPMIAMRQFLINKMSCGDLVDIIGIVKLNPLQRGHIRTRFTSPYIEVLGITKKSKDPEQIEINPEEEMEILELSTHKDIYDELIQSIAPTIYGMDVEKEACLLSMVGGVDRKTEVNLRGNIHVLFVGDPSTAKSQLLYAVSNLAPRAMYAAGRGATAAGLTAAMTKDDNGEWMIEAGVLVLADKGVACIDEIDKMRNEDRVNIHEAMEQQVVHIDKAGVHATLMARTSVIAAANPLNGRYDSKKSVLENLSGFPPSLFSRFDLIFVVLDEANKINDKNVVTHILNVGKHENEEKPLIGRDLFKKYIAYAKRTNPELSDDAKKKLSDYFLIVRSNTNDETIPIFFRQFEGLRRLCEAHARILLRKTAMADDADASIKIFNEFLKSVKFDIETFETQKPKTVRDKMGIIMDIFSANHGEVSQEVLFEECAKNGIDRGTAFRLITEFLKAGTIYEPKVGFYHKT